MPKITEHEGPSNASEPRVDVQEPILAQPQERPGEHGEFHADRNEAEEYSLYEDLTKDELVRELRERDLPTTGNKPELVARLLEDDEGEEE